MGLGKGLGNEKVEGKLVTLDGDREKNIELTISDALADFKDFRGVMIIGLVRLPDGFESHRTYISGLNRLERKGLLVEALKMEP